MEVSAEVAVVVAVAVVAVAVEEDLHWLPKTRFHEPPAIEKHKAPYQIHLTEIGQ